jgi:hypothetical protein
MLGVKSLNKYARAGEIFCQTLACSCFIHDSSTQTEVLILFYSTTPPTYRSHTRSLLSSHTICSCMGLSWMLKVPSLHFLLSKAPPTGVKGAPMKRPFFCRSFDLSLFFLPLLLKHVSNGILLIKLILFDDLNLALFF